jgi:hypothetical protein
MRVDIKSLCMGCMDFKQSGLCPNPETCGWTDQTESHWFPQLPPCTLLDNRYVLGKVLGQGGFGITYLAADLHEYRKLALKEYFPSSFATRTTDRRTVTYAGSSNREPYQYGLNKFEEEGRTLQRFRHHPNVVSVIHSFKGNGTGYIVMEYLDGFNLLAYLRDQPDNKISYDATMRILFPIMDALREVHRAGVIHRDISPDNIYICRSGPIKLLDFGAARLALRDQTQSLQLILKPGFTPEEQYRSNGVPGPYTDIYSLAATAYRCITGRIPPEATERLSEDNMQPPGELAKLPARAEKALMKALAVRARDRFQTIEEFQKALSGDTPPPKQKSAAQVFRSFLCWWATASALMIVGNLLRSNIGLALFCAALIPAAFSFRGVYGMLKAAASAGDKPSAGSLVFLFGFVTILGVVLTGISPFGAALLAGNIFLAKEVITRLSAGEASPARSRFLLRFKIGELAGNTLELGSSAVTIGRQPDSANVIIPLPEISAAHARIWADPAAPCVWIEDLDSRNGTFTRKAGPESTWVRIQRRESLAKGDRFCLCGEDLAQFEIEENE